LKVLIEWILSIEWSLLIIVCLTLGLAPFVPQPHFFEKISMLFAGTLKKPIDWFDLFMHGAPWVVLVAKSVLTIAVKYIKV